jgi:hypothetical protein
VKDGVIDPAKVARTALQNASSIAGLMLTTEALIAEIPEEKEAPAGPPRSRRHGRRNVLSERPAKRSIEKLLDQMIQQLFFPPLGPTTGDPKIGEEHTNAVVGHFPRSFFHASPF